MICWRLLNICNLNSCMLKTKGSLLVVLTILTILVPQTALGAHSCEPNKICASSGDHAKYYEEIFGRNTTVSFNFGDFIDPDNIKVEFNSISEGNSTITSEILNLKNNTSTLNDGSHAPFIYMGKVPLNVTADHEFFEQSTNFNGFNRIIYGAHSENATVISDFQVDKETGLVLKIDMPVTKDLVDKPFTTKFVIKLLDTNIITSSNTQLTSKLVSTEIPQWVKNIANWWSEGSLTDNDFIKGIQYLIQQGIITIPPTQSGSTTSHQIPTWIKNNAGWWAGGQISDEEFVKGIQFLISVGIINV